MIQGHKDKTSYDDLNRRACDAERTRDEALVKMDAVQNEMKRMDMTYVELVIAVKCDILLKSWHHSAPFLNITV